MAEKSNNPTVKTTSIRGLEEDFVPSAGMGIEKNLFTAEITTRNLETLYNVIKASPEVTACLLAILEDIMADGWRFSALSGDKRKSEKDIKDAKEFETRAKYFKALTDATFDYLATGNGYILKLSIDESKLKTIITAMTRSVHRKMKVKFSKDKIFELVKQDLRTDRPKSLQVLKSSTVKINYDETGDIASYEQKVGSKTRVYDVKDIIHLKALSIGGQPYGFTALEPLLSDIAVLIFAKDYAGRYFENDGTPTFLINMPKESPNGRNYKNLKKELKELKKKKQKYRTLITTGEIKIDQISKFTKDLEFSKLIAHWTQIVIMCLGVPAGRIHFTLDKKVGDVSATGKEDSGYSKKISFTQKAFEEVLNADLWSHFGVKKTFKRGYKIDEMREAEITRILSEVGAITIEEARERIGMDPELPKGTMARSIGSDNRARDQGNENAESPPADGDSNRDNKLSSLKMSQEKLKSFNSDAISVKWQTFIAIVEQKVGFGNFTKGNVLYIKTDTEFTLFFNDGSWKYKTKIPLVDDEKDEQFRLEWLRNAIKLTI